MDLKDAIKNKENTNDTEMSQSNSNHEEIKDLLDKAQKSMAGAAQDKARLAAQVKKLTTEKDALSKELSEEKQKLSQIVIYSRRIKLNSFTLWIYRFETLVDAL